MQFLKRAYVQPFWDVINLIIVWRAKTKYARVRVRLVIGLRVVVRARRCTCRIVLRPCRNTCFSFFQSSGGWVKIKLKLSHFHLRTSEIHVGCQFNPTLPLQQQLAHLSLGPKFITPQPTAFFGSFHLPYYPYGRD